MPDSIERLDRPRRVCLCGSTQFKAEYEEALKRETLAGRIVLTVGLFGHLEDIDMDGTAKKMLDELHLAKIDLADEVLVIDCPRPRCPVCKAWWEKGEGYGDGWTLRPACACRPITTERVPYIGDSTRREIAYALSLGKPVRYLSNEERIPDHVRP